MNTKSSCCRAPILFSVCFLLFGVCMSRAQKPELVVPTGHSQAINCVSFSPDDKYIVTASDDYTAKLWEVTTGQEIRTFRGHLKEVTSASFSLDGKYLVTGSRDNTAKLWEITSSQEIRTFRGHSGDVNSVSFSPDGKYVATGSSDNSVKLWEVSTGKKIRMFGDDNGMLVIPMPTTGEKISFSTGPSAQINSVSFSPDGKYLITGRHSGSVELWEVTSGKEIRTFQTHSSSIYSVNFSPDSKYVVAGSDDHTAKLWEATTNMKIHTFQGHSSSIRSVSFSADGKSVVTGGRDNIAKLWKVTSGEEIRTFVGHSASINSVSFNSDGKYVVTGSDDHTAKLWKVATGQEIRTFSGHSSPINSVSFSPDGKYLVTGNDDHTAKLWEVATSQEIRSFAGHSSPVNSVSFSPDGKYVVTGSDDHTAKLWEVATSQEIRTFTGHTSPINSVSFSPDGEYVVTGSDDHTAKLWEVTIGKKTRTFPGHFYTSHTKLINSVRFSPDGKYVVAGSSDQTAKLWEVTTGKEVYMFRGHSASIHSVNFDPDGKYVVTGSDDRTAKLWKVETGNEIRTFRGHFSSINSISFSPNGRYLVTGSSDATSKIWDVNTGKEVATLISIGENDWVVTTPDGLFDASEGAEQYVHFVKDLEVIDLNQLKERYYEPGLLAKLMGFNKEPLLTVKPFTAEELYPEVELTAPQPNDPNLHIHLTNRGGGIGRVVVFINGKEMTADARKARTDANAKELRLAVDLADHPYLVPGEENVIEVKAFNAGGYLSSRNVRAVYQPPAKTRIAPPYLWAIVAGISNYRGEAIDLAYAAKDAMDVGQALQIGAQRLFGIDHLHLKLLTTEKVDDKLYPNKANLLQAFQEVAAQAKATDILLVYLAGHGVNHGGQDGDYYYLTVEARSGDLQDPEIRKSVALSSVELTELIKQVPALKQVLILDTCAAGRLVEKLTESRDIPSSQKRALERLKDRTGLHILAGAAADAVSYEASRFGQGLLTYSLLLGMRGAALRDDEFIDISKLFQFSADQVPMLAKDIGGIQRPIVAAPRLGTSFDIGQVTSEDKTQIPLATPRPLVLRANFQDEERFIDRLNLTTLVNNQLRELSARGRDAQFIFVDAAEFPEAYSLAGRYRTNGDKLSMLVRLFRGEQKVGEFTVVGNPSALEQLTADILKETEKQIAKR